MVKLKMKTIRLLMIGLTLSASLNAWGYMIDDARNGANTYWGSNAHGYGDVIAGAGDLTFDVNGASISRTAGWLNVDIYTNFAGHAGVDSWAGPHGIGYGDLFLASAWHPYGTDAHHTSDNASNGTLWSYALSLDNRWNNNGGVFNLYRLSGPSNLNNVLLPNSFLTCGAGCVYRDGQAVAVNTASATVNLVGSGIWTVKPGELSFLLDVSGLEIGGWNDIAIHWGPTCQNDVIEGGGHIPEPSTWMLLSFGLIGLGFSRARAH